MITDIYRNSSLIAVSAIIATMTPNTYSSFNVRVPVVRAVYDERNTVPNLKTLSEMISKDGFNKIIEHNSSSMNSISSSTYADSKEGGDMFNIARYKVKASSKLGSIYRADNMIELKRYKENNDYVSINVPARKTVKGKSKMSAIRRADGRLI